MNYWTPKLKLNNYTTMKFLKAFSIFYISPTFAQFPCGNETTFFDDDTFFFNDVERLGCEKIVQKGKCNLWDRPGRLAKNHCPISCNNCARCEDDKTFRIYKEDRYGHARRYTCADIAVGIVSCDDRKIGKRLVSEFCRKSCSACYIRTSTPSDAPSTMPSLSPSKKPSSAPSTTMHPSLSCASKGLWDDYTFFFNNVKHLDCKGLAIRGKCNKYDTSGRLPKYYCPVSCNYCSEKRCQDQKKVWVRDNGNHRCKNIPNEKVSCDDQQDYKENTKKLVSQFCRESCQLCNYSSKRPSETPTSVPSMDPRSLPSTHPSEIPTLYPSKTLSSAPSISPTNVPTSFPTKLPSILPSAPPTYFPSTKPTNIPSMQPSSVPSKNPSETPTASPSKTFSSAPSDSPTNLPTSFSN